MSYPGAQPVFAAADFFSAKFLFASLFWGSVGIGYWIYGKRQSSLWAMLGGVGMIVASYFIGSVVLMSLACLTIAAGVYFMVQRGD